MSVLEGLPEQRKAGGGLSALPGRRSRKKWRKVPLPQNKKTSRTRRLQALVRLDTYFFGVISLFSLDDLIFGMYVSQGDSP